MYETSSTFLAYDKIVSIDILKNLSDVGCHANKTLGFNFDGLLE